MGGRRLAAFAVAIVVGVGGALMAWAPHAGALSKCPTGQDCPQAVDDLYSTSFNTTLNVAAPGVLANDLGDSTTTVDIADSDDVSFFGNATITLHSNGSFQYKPDPNTPFSGIDNFDYYIQQKDGSYDFATAYIIVNASIQGETYYTHVNQALNVAAPGVFANDTGLDVSSDRIVDQSNAHGSVTLNDDGSFQYTPANGYSGSASFKYEADDYNADLTYDATATIKVDSTAPTNPVITAPSTLTTLATKFPVSWKATDPIAGVASYDVQSRLALWNGKYSTWSDWKLNTSATSATFTGAAGRSYCFRVRAYDHAGNVSDYGTGFCTSVPLTANQLTYAGTWTGVHGSVYGGTVRISSTKGSVASMSGAQLRRVFLIATKCASCGTVQVKVNGAVTANVNLANSATVHMQSIQVASFGGAQTGVTITVTVTSPNGKSVQIEGLGIYR